jgi:hypothetical protein
MGEPAMGEPAMGEPATPRHAVRSLWSYELGQEPVPLFHA